MIFWGVAQNTVFRSSSLRSSYIEISRFLLPRHHGLTVSPVRCLKIANREYSMAVTSSETVRNMLEKYKKTVDYSLWNTQDSLQPEINTVAEGTELSLHGYMITRRDQNKKLSFAVLRNPKQSYSIQLVSSSSADGSDGAQAHETLRSLREWTPIVVRGILQKRVSSPKGENTVHPLADQRELLVKSVLPLNEIAADVIVKEEVVFGPNQRHLQLRTNASLRDALVVRDHTMATARSWLRSRTWQEIETPILFKSTPEGAREFLVPTRNKGLAYALPQSPQQYKQILMASGFKRYYQFARCFRDEDLRADRQPEFTQLDLEVAWASERLIIQETEDLLRMLWSEVLSFELQGEFLRLTYEQAMACYGSDKPDLRFPAKIQNITKYLQHDFIDKISSLSDPTIEAFMITLSPEVQVNRKFVQSFFDSAEGKPYLTNPDGQPAAFCGDFQQPLGGLGPMGHQFVMEPPEGLEVEHGDLLVVQARQRGPFSGGSTVLGNLRLALHKAALAQGLIEPPKTKFEPCWVTDFPLFMPSIDTEPGQEGSAGLAATHHPFTAPKTAGDVDLLLADPSRAIAAHYDIVINGVELGGGSRRIHNADVQEFVFRDVLKMSPQRIEDFRHLLDVLKSGCPPHAGIALGWDRLLTVMLEKESVRDVIAFPKSGSGEDVLVKSPNPLTQQQLETYHLQLKK